VAAAAVWNGHPFRIRYMVALTMALAATVGLGVGLLSRYRRLAAILVLLSAPLETPPLSGHSPMVIEARRDANNVRARQALTQSLLQHDDHSPILASMGSLAPYMQETSLVGLSIRQYIKGASGSSGATA
jgi:hypothetical protein